MRVRKRGPVLSAAVRSDAGELARAVDWELPGADRRHVAVLEVAAQDVGAAVLRLEGDGGPWRSPFPCRPYPHREPRRSTPS